MKKVLGAFSRFMHPKMKLFPATFDGFWKFSPCKLYEKFLGAISRLMRPKKKQFAVKFRRILELLRLQGL